MSKEKNIAGKRGLETEENHAVMTLTGAVQTMMFHNEKQNVALVQCTRSVRVVSQTRQAEVEARIIGVFFPDPNMIEEFQFVVEYEGGSRKPVSRQQISEWNNSLMFELLDPEAVKQAKEPAPTAEFTQSTRWGLFGFFRKPPQS